MRCKDYIWWVVWVVVRSQKSGVAEVGALGEIPRFTAISYRVGFICFSWKNNCTSVIFFSHSNWQPHMTSNIKVQSAIIGRICLVLLTRTEVIGHLETQTSSLVLRTSDYHLVIIWWLFWTGTTKVQMSKQLPAIPATKEHKDGLRRERQQSQAGQDDEDGDFHSLYDLCWTGRQLRNMAPITTTGGGKPGQKDWGGSQLRSSRLPL